MKRQIVNIVNFIRGFEPRDTVDLFEPVVEQMKLLQKYNLKGTFLLQYDALIESVYVDFLKENESDKIELGIWLEIMQPLVEKAGIEWKGRYAWDWHANVGFSVGYTLSEREKIVDIIMEEFKSTFGYYPRSVGSWTIDAHTIAYISDKYGLDATCNCKDQWGTDGYTVWGGYYNQAYYPSRNNMFSPAQTKENQIDAPLFRMLGSDPLYQYDFGLDLHNGSSQVQGVVTLEPVYCGDTGGGGVPSWVDWYLKENFNGKCLTFGYTQAGQENSFGWEAMKKGLTYQIEKIVEMQEKGEVEVITLGEAGKWFKSEFEYTPASTIVAENDWKNEKHKTVWYNCKNYRFNLFAEDNKFWIRDMYIFNENYRERYFDEVCKKEYLVFDNLPVIDGNRWSGNGIRAGIYPVIIINGKETPVTFQDMIYEENGQDAITTFTNTVVGNIKFEFSPVKINIEIEKADANFAFKVVYNDEFKDFPTLDVENKNIIMNYNDFEYKINILDGTICKNSDITIYPKNNKITIII